MEGAGGERLMRDHRNILVVVPANAGTHNHRRLWSQRKMIQNLSNDIRHGVWVPAFAGTTV